MLIFLWGVWNRSDSLIQFTFLNYNVGGWGESAFPIVGGRIPPSSPLFLHSGWQSIWEMFVKFGWSGDQQLGFAWGRIRTTKKKVTVVFVFGHSGRPMVISSGMQSMDTMKQVYQIVKPLNPNFCFLQCTSAYPLLPEDVNLRIISVSRRKGHCLIGPLENGFS